MTAGGRTRKQLILRGQFARLWWAGTVSSIGDWVELFATIALGNLIGGTPGAIVPLIGRFAPGLIFSPLGGLIADRMNRRRTLIITDVFRGILVLSLIWVDTLPELFAVSVAVEMMTLIRQPAREAIVPTLVSEDELASANALSVLSAYGTFPLGAVLWAGFGILPAWTQGLEGLPAWAVVNNGSEWTVGYVTDSVTFFVSALIVLTMAATSLPRLDSNGPWWDWRAPLSDMAEGVSFIRGHKGVRIVILGMSAALFGGGALVGLGTDFAKSNFLSGANGGLGFLSIALGSGVGLGVLAVKRIDELAIHRTVLFGSALLVAGIGLVAISGSTSLIGAAFWAATMGFGAGIAYVGGLTYLGEKVDDELRGRTFAALFTLGRTALLGSLGIAAFGSQLLDDRFGEPFNDGVRLLLLLGGLVIVLSGVTTLWSVREVLGQSQPGSDS